MLTVTWGYSKNSPHPSLSLHPAPFLVLLLKVIGDLLLQSYSEGKNVKVCDEESITMKAAGFQMCAS